MKPLSKKTISILSTVFSALGLISAIGGFFIDDTQNEYLLAEKIDEKLKERGL